MQQGKGVYRLRLLLVTRYTPLLHPLTTPLTLYATDLRLLFVTRAAPVGIEGHHIVRRLKVKGGEIGGFGGG